MSQDQRLEANQLLARARMTNEPCNRPQVLATEQDRARADANSRQLAVDLAGAERELAVTVEQANASVHREWERANAAEERADHLDRGNKVLAEELAAAHTLTAHLERRIRALAGKLAKSTSQGAAVMTALTESERIRRREDGGYEELLARVKTVSHALADTTARADRADLRVTQLEDRIAEDDADETTAAVRLANVCVHLGCCDLAFAETAAKTMVERAAQVDAAEASLTTARAEWTKTRGGMEAEIERLHERLRLLGRVCPGPSPAARLAAVLADADEHGPTVPPATTAAALDDPRMDGTTWNMAPDVSVAMLHAWPFWERWTADSTEVLPCHQVDFGPGANTTHKLRPLRLPGMDSSGDGVVLSAAMSAAHFSRIKGWQYGHVDGRWYSAVTAEERVGSVTAASRWRPASWATPADVTEPEPTLPQ